MSMQ